MFAERLMKIAIIGSLAAVPIAWQAAAQAQQVQPYAGLQTREIKALSHEQMEDLAAGRGMGLALAAELNGYPGPRHVLELATQLSLTDEQRNSIQRLFDYAAITNFGDIPHSAVRPIHRPALNRCSHMQGCRTPCTAT